MHSAQQRAFANFTQTKNGDGCAIDDFRQYRLNDQLTTIELKRQSHRFSFRKKITAPKMRPERLIQMCPLIHACWALSLEQYNGNLLSGSPSRAE